MSQLIACATIGGIVVASDSKAEFFQPDGTIRTITQERLIPVSSHAVLASAGAWEAHDICKEFAKFAKSEGLTDIDALVDAAIPFFTGKHDEILRKICTISPPDPIINMYLLLAGYSPKTPENPYKIFVIWDRPKPPKIEYNQAAHIFTLPRRMGLEFTLNSLAGAYLTQPLQQNNTDTMLDLIADLGGGILIAFLGTLYLKRKCACNWADILLEPGFEKIMVHFWR
jgi:hypothetical protein